MEEFDYISLKNSKELRKVINENIDAILQIDIITKDSKIVGQSAYNCINSIMSRMDAIIVHLNSVIEKMAHDKDVFALYDFLNQAQTLTDCIYKLARIFHTNLTEITKKSDVFNELGEEGTGNDDAYFRYIRSLCSVHPFDTTKHGEYQKYINEWCPTVRRKFSFDNISDAKIDNEEIDFVAIVYSEDFINSRFIYLSISSLLRYINRKIDFIEEIVKKINIDLNKRLFILRKEQLKTILDFKNNTVGYLEYLAVEGKKRYSDDRFIKFSLDVFKSSFKSIELNKELKEYQKLLFKTIITYHDAIQNMKYEPDELFNINENLLQLYDIDCEIKPIEEKYVISKNLEKILKQLDKEVKKGKSKKELDLLSFEIVEFVLKNSSIELTSSEIGRIEIKKNDSSSLYDYSLDDWHLFLSYLIKNKIIPEIKK